MACRSRLPVPTGIRSRLDSSPHDPAIISQLVPFDTSSAQLPATAAMMAVLAAPPARGTTLEALDVTVCVPDRFLMRISRPGKDDAVGSVTTQLDPALLQVRLFSLAATVKSAVLATGEPRLN